MQVDLLNYLDKENIILNLKGKSKRKVLSNIIDHLISVKKIDKKYRKEILKALIQREEMGSTGI
ncbi:MAG: PTS sugar transporter subunit IIA, partial [Candidatus Omnitrophota bacterium]